MILCTVLQFVPICLTSNSEGKYIKKCMNYEMRNSFQNHFKEFWPWHQLFSYSNLRVKSQKVKDTTLASQVKKICNINAKI